MANPRQNIEGATRHAVDCRTRGFVKPGEEEQVPIEEQEEKPKLEAGKTVDGDDVEEKDEEVEEESSEETEEDTEEEDGD